MTIAVDLGRKATKPKPKNILKRKRKLVALLLLSYRCIVSINVLWLFLTVPWVGLQCVIVVFPDHAHLLFELDINLILENCKTFEIQ